MKISIGNDHAGPEYKKAIVKYLEDKGITVTNYGVDDFASVDYPDYAHKVGADIDEGKADFGIVICGSGNGIAMTANKHQGVRCALCWTKEIAELARLHNDANVISIPARYTSIEQAVAMVETFLNTAFEGGRHQNRVNKITCA
ncbi:MAG: ribose 5-phosphate isomerase B [Flavobacterium sp.]